MPKPTQNNIALYLQPTRYTDYADREVKACAEKLFAGCRTDARKAEKAFLFVRDAISHSWDIQSRHITVTASQVLRDKEGICYAKSNLLAALLRSAGIPAGFSYQRLTIGDTPDNGMCIHALTGLYLREEDAWIRVDARGNKPGIDAQFSLAGDKLAFPIRPAYGEIDYQDIHPDPHPATMRALESNSDCLWMYLHGLPERI